MNQTIHSLQKEYDDNGEKLFYDRIYSTKGDDAMRPLWVYRDWFKKFGEPKSGSLLDVGCGTGYFLQVASESGLTVSGVELSDSAVAVARKHVPHGDIRQGYGEHLEYDDGSFDYTACIGTLEHYQDINAGLSELVRVTKPGGSLFIVVPNKEYFLWKFNLVRKGTKQRDFEELKTLDEWKKFFEDGGLRIKSIYQDKYPASQVKVFQSKNIVKIFRRLVYRLLWLVVPMRYTYQFVFILEKK